MTISAKIIPTRSRPWKYCGRVAGPEQHPYRLVVALRADACSQPTNCVHSAGAYRSPSACGGTRGGPFPSG